MQPVSRQVEVGRPLRNVEIGEYATDARHEILGQSTRHISFLECLQSLVRESHYGHCSA